MQKCWNVYNKCWFLGTHHGFPGGAPPIPLRVHRQYCWLCTPVISVVHRQEAASAFVWISQRRITILHRSVPTFTPQRESTHTAVCTHSHRSVKKILWHLLFTYFESRIKRIWRMILHVSHILSFISDGNVQTRSPERTSRPQAGV